MRVPQDLTAPAGIRGPLRPRTAPAFVWLLTALLALLPVAPVRAQSSVRCSGRPIPQFVDVTQKAGIHFVHNSDPDKRYIPESMGGGVILIDYNRDGWPDIYFTNGPTISQTLHGKKVYGALYRNNHDGTFTNVTAGSGLTHSCMAMGGAVGDYNNDGWPDLYITCLGHNILYRNNGNGTFTDVTAQAGVGDPRFSTGAAFGDYNNDGYVDLMVTNYVSFDIHHLPPFGGSSTCRYKGIPVQCGPRGLPGAGDTLYRNNGNGTFTNVSKQAGVSGPHHYYGLGVVWADFNNTGRQDIYVANDSTPNYLYKNLGNGTFKEIGFDSGTAFSDDGSEQASMGVAVGDYLHTGRPSLFVTNFENENDDLYRNDGDWNFTETSWAAGVASPSIPLLEWGDAFADVDNDGWLDLVAVSGHVYPQVANYLQPKLLLMNQANGKFCNASTEAGPAFMEKQASRGLAVGDLFNNGWLDLVVENIDGRPMILRNLGVPGRHWVSFELQGTKSNRLAIGARVQIVAGGITQTSWVQSGGSYLSQSDLRVHFGLGTATKIDSVQVRWPSGHIDTMKNLAADRFYSVLEGSGIVPAARIRPTPVRSASQPPSHPKPAPAKPAPAQP
jgi:hypothetical protein